MQINKIKRRDFVKNTSILSASFLAGRLPSIAGPFKPGELAAGNIPADKRLDPEWVQSLYKRGNATVYRQSKNELLYIGMPVGGIACGCVYAGGDGRLWLWDVFNKNQEGIEPKTVQMTSTSAAGSKQERKILSRDGANYIAPSTNIRPLEQGFAFLIEFDGQQIIKRQESADWDDIEFEAGYPVATIRYIDTKLPVEIRAEIYSPFIPLDEKNSGLPATIISFTLKNKSSQQVKVSITGWLENKVLIESGKEELHQRVNTALSNTGLHNVLMTAEAKSGALDPVITNPDFGSLSIAALAQNAVINTNSPVFTQPGLFLQERIEAKKQSIHTTLLGSVTTQQILQPGRITTCNFVITWHFANLSFKGIQGNGRYYSTEFKNAGEVASYIQKHFTKLSRATQLFKKNWYDSTLPYWFLERTLLNVSTLATTTCHRFTNGRFYAWEGVGCCPGTCTHVWQYAQAAARLFPALERETREKVDLGISFNEENGMIWFRAEADKRPAIDGQAGTVLRIYREHQMSANSTFLITYWAKIKKAVQFVINQDRNKDGMEDTPMENTLDAVWDGEISWIVGLCLAAVKAGQMMAEEMGDTSFAEACKQYVDNGKKNMDEKLFNGEYFIHRPDKEKGRQKLGSYNTCHIDQVYGQSWAFQVGLGRVIDQQKTLSALRALWKYNFTPNVGPYIATHTGGRPYALAGEGGMIMNTNPANEKKPYGDNETWQLGYFHECMSGFEHQVASHLMAEGMTDEALILTRMIHDRYHASKRNPFNEIECSDHYARAMASFGTYVTACGFEYHGPKGYLRFAPKWNKENWKGLFTSAAGWGTYQQHKPGLKQLHSIFLAYGLLQLQKISVEMLTGVKAKMAKATLNKQTIPIAFEQIGNEVTIRFAKEITIKENKKLVIRIS